MSPETQEATFYPDGFTKEGYIAEVERLHGAVAFTYEPARIADYFRHVNRPAGETSEAACNRISLMLVKCIKKWDVVHPVTGEAVPIDAKTITAGLHPEIVYSLQAIVLGLMPRGEKPTAEAA